MKKFLGQYFLVDENIKKKILNYIKICKNDVIIEIGSGNGAISREISMLSKESFLIEIDKGLMNELKKKVSDIKQANIYHDDILKFNLKDLTKKYKKIRIIGNIPYKITSKILFLIENFSDHIKDAHLVIQKEFADKLIISKNKINNLNLILNYKFEIKKLFDIKPKSFNPIPKVTSSFIKLIPIKKKIYVISYSFLKKIVMLIFRNGKKKTRKFISNINNIKKYVNIEKKVETIKIKELIRLSNLLFITKNS